MSTLNKCVRILLPRLSRGNFAHSFSLSVCRARTSGGPRVPGSLNRRVHVRFILAIKSENSSLA